MISVTRMEELFTNLLETRADELARSTGFVQRARKLSGADFVQILTFGHLRAPTSSLDQLTQVAQLRDVQISAILRATQVQKWRLLALTAGMWGLLRLPRVETFAHLMYERWHVKRRLRRTA